MPEKEHRRLELQARARGLKGEAKDRYVYGTLAKIEKQRKEKK